MDKMLSVYLFLRRRCSRSSCNFRNKNEEETHKSELIESHLFCSSELGDDRDVQTANIDTHTQRLKRKSILNQWVWFRLISFFCYLLSENDEQTAEHWNQIKEQIQWVSNAIVRSSTASFHNHLSVEQNKSSHHNESNVQLCLWSRKKNRK